MLEVASPRLDAHGFLRGMDARHLDALSAAASEVTFPVGQRIFADCGYADKFWLVQSGLVALDVYVPGEGLAVVGRVGIGGLVGWSSLLPPYQWVFGAVCVTDVRAFQFDARAVRELCAADLAFRAEFTQRVLQVVAGRCKDARARLAPAS